MTVYTLFCAPDTYAMGAHAILEEAGADYRLHWVELFTATPDPLFAAASPHCRTPALTGPDGAVFESGAVALYVAERHPEAGLAVPPGDPRRGAFLQWLHYLGTTLQPEVMIQFHPEFYMGSTADRAALRAASMRRLRRVFAVLDAALEPGPYFLGAHPTVPDYVLGLQTVWDMIFGADGIAAYPNIARQRDALLGRPAVARVLDCHARESARRHDATPG
ncbi:MAG: glutathione S-transferase family protein [Rhodobacteraceae bacterium]|nr:glutathione S-transferase family protein [Paracoccaceae bacterium]